VILFGISLTMGYIVGRHSSPVPLNTTAAASQEPVSDRAPSPAGPPPGHAEVVNVEAKKGETPPPENQERTAGMRPATAPAEAPPPAETRQPETRAANSAVAAPAPGSYLQVSEA
jgi:hypothetical protein